MVNFISGRSVQLRLVHRLEGARELKDQRELRKQELKAQSRVMWTTPGLRPLVEPLILD